MGNSTSASYGSKSKLGGGTKKKKLKLFKRKNKKGNKEGQEEQKNKKVNKKEQKNKKGNKKEQKKSKLAERLGIEIEPSLQPTSHSLDESTLSPPHQVAEVLVDETTRPPPPLPPYNLEEQQVRAAVELHAEPSRNESDEDHSEDDGTATELSSNQHDNPGYIPSPDLSAPRHTSSQSKLNMSHDSHDATRDTFDASEASGRPNGHIKSRRRGGSTGTESLRSDAFSDTASDVQGSESLDIGRMHNKPNGYLKMNGHFGNGHIGAHPGSKLSVMSEPVNPYKTSSLNGDVLLADRLTDTSGYLEQHYDSQFLMNRLNKEKVRSRHHKTKYASLKDEHRRLRSELIASQEDIAQLSRDKDKLLDRQSEHAASYHASISSLKGVISEIRAQIPDKKSEQLRNQELIKRAEQLLKDRLASVQLENDNLKRNVSELGQEISSLKSQDKERHSQQCIEMEELRKAHEIQVSALSKEKDDLMKQSAESAMELQNLRHIQQEKYDLEDRLTVLLSELEEIKTEKVRSDSGYSDRSNNPGIADTQDHLRGLEIERNSLRKQLDSQAREVSMLLDNQTTLTKRLFEEEQKSAMLRNQLESAQHESTLAISQCSLESNKLLAQVERDRESLRSQIADLQSHLDTQKSVIGQLEGALCEVERREKRKRSPRGSDSSSSERFEDTRTLQGRLQSLEKQKRDAEEEQRTERNRSDQRIRELQNSKDILETELYTLRARNSSNHTQKDLEYERDRSTDLRALNMRLEAENSALKMTEVELTELIGNLRMRATGLNEEMRRIKEREMADSLQAEKILSRHKRVWADEKNELQRSNEQLETKLKEVQEKLNSETVAYNKKKQVYTKLVEKLRGKLETCETQKQEITLKLEKLRGYIAPDSVRKIRKELKDLKSKHKEYKHIMMAGEISQVPIGNLSFGAASVHNTSFDISASMELPELTGLLNKMDKLEEESRSETTECGGFSSDISAVSTIQG